MTSRTIGVLGVMDPSATVDFFRRIAALALGPEPTDGDADSLYWGPRG